MTKPFADIASEMRNWFDTFGAYIEGAFIAPRTKGALRELHSAGVSIANELQTRSGDVSTCQRLSGVENELQRLTGVVAALVASDAEVHESAEDAIQATEQLAEAVETLATAEATEVQNGVENLTTG